MGLWKNSFNANSKVTRHGGFAVKVINDTGAVSVEGTVVETSSSISNGVSLVGIGDPDPIGIVLDSGVPDGEEMWITTNGLAKVFYIGSVTIHYFARVTVSGDTGNEAGKLIAEPVPSPPFASDKHFQECGHVKESRVGAGLALTYVHFN